jgi:excisionase family DNA binding protein
MHEQNKTSPDDLLVSREVMAAARISRRTLDRWVEDGKLAVIRIDGGQRRYRRDVVEALIGTPVHVPAVEVAS